MKTQKLAAILGVAALALGACGGKDKSGGGKGDYTACLVSDSGGWDDKSFNQSAKEGLDKAVKDLGVKSKTAESKTDSDFTRNVEGMVGENCNLVMGVGFKLSDAISASAKDNADINYSLVDSTFKKNLDNERALVFNTHEAAYLAGYAAARERSGPAISGWKRSSTSMRIEALATNIPAFHRYLPVARYSAAVCSSGFSTKAVTALATPSRPPVSM